MLERNVLAVVLGLGLAGPVVAAAAAVARVASVSRALIWTVAGVLIAGAFTAVWRLRRQFPASLDGAARRQRLRTGLWLALALVALAQLGRLSAFMADPGNTFGSAFPDRDLTKHMCLPAYVQAAALARDGDTNVYEDRHWPAFRQGEDKLGGYSPVAELGPHLLDPYEYPPQFLLLPRLALALTNHFLIIRSVWFAFESTVFLGIALLLAGHIGEREGLVVGLLVPALFASLSLLVNLQWGQAHVLTLTLAMGALVAFRRGHAPLGGALLAAAALFKLFPGLLLLYLILQRRWRDVGWTVAGSIFLTLLALAVFGVFPFEAFIEYQLPRIGNGDAFSFFHGRWIAVSRNLSVPGVVFKLGLLGAPAMTNALANEVGWIYTLLLVMLVARAAGQRDRSALDEALLWLGVLCLGSLRSPLAPGIYVGLGGLWILTLFASRAKRARDVLFVALGFWLIPGGPPLPNRTADVAVAFLGQVWMMLVGFRAVWQSGRSTVPEPATDALAPLS